MELFDKLSFYLSFDFVKYALIVGILISLCCAVLGVVLVLKRYSMIGDGLSHVAFGAMAIATILNVTDLYIMLPVTIIVAVILLRFSSSKSSVGGEAKIAMFATGSMAIGYLLLNTFNVSGNVSGDVCTSLFGSMSILTLSSFDVWFSIALTLIVIVFFVLFYHKIFAITFDGDFAKASGINRDLYNTLLAIIMAIVIVLAMKLVGTLLISALVVFPTISAMKVSNSYKGVTILACIFSVLGSAIGILASLLLGTPVGVTIVVLDIVILGICYLIGSIK